MIDGPTRALSEVAATRLDDGRAVEFLARAERHRPAIEAALAAVYGPTVDAVGLAGRLLEIALDVAAARDETLTDLDDARLRDPDWFQRSSMVGYVAYADRFAGSLAGVAERLDYLAELGVNYLHLMPLLASRPMPNDGGYAVVDYAAVDPSLGNMADLEDVAAALHARGMSLCLDLVINHTAAEHVWARRARMGDARYRAFYRVFTDRAEPDAFEATMRQVFPGTAPGNFSYVDELGGWVWTRFHDYQWDLDYRNPEVLLAMFDVMGDLANRGADVLRLDAAPFIWKELGTDGENRPNAHRILQVFRTAMEVAAPGVVFKAEAIVSPDELVQYLGVTDGDPVPECHLAYHNLLMVMVWSSLATGDARLMGNALRRLRPAPPETAWVTYLRCHDDIGWAITDEDAATVGWGGWSHRRFLNDWFSGAFPGSPARGALFQPDEVTGDARISGTAASLCGVETARVDGDEVALEVAVRRLVAAYSLVYSFGGIPLVYMGDELAVVNDHGYLADPERRDDNRWMHRPSMDWETAQRRHDTGTVEAGVFGWFARLAEVRAATASLHAGGSFEILDAGDDAVFAHRRAHPVHGVFVGLLNVAEDPRRVDVAVVAGSRLDPADPVLTNATEPLVVAGGEVELPGLSFAWYAS